MLDSSDLVAFVAATDLRRARAFYEQKLGLRVLEHNDSPAWWTRTGPCSA
jgi:catechol 2,3-dioxygenase-like lactoylglutathione lyase family enzyme